MSIENLAAVYVARNVSLPIGKDQSERVKKTNGLACSVLLMSKKKRRRNPPNRDVLVRRRQPIQAGLDDWTSTSIVSTLRFYQQKHERQRRGLVKGTNTLLTLDSICL